MASDRHAELARQGAAAWQRGDVAAARTAWEAVAIAGRASPQLWVLLAQARDASGANAMLVDQALDGALGMDPRHLGALVMKGDRAPDDRAACSFYAMALNGVTDAERHQPATMRLIEQATAKYHAATERFAGHLRAHVTVDAGARFEEAIALVTGEKQLFLQQPSSFFFPGLPHRQFFPASEFTWAAPVAARVDAIRAELIALVERGEGSRPYLQDDPTRASYGHELLGDPRWSAFHLIENGRPVSEHAARCPETMAALATVPMPRIAARSPMALFSVLRPGTHIPPHHGLLNTRLICHLPLIVPDGCRLRVGNEVRPVRAGELMIFDDSIEHEAWNDGDATRIVLLFEIWRPELTAAERDALTTLFESIGLYDGGQ